MEVFYNFNSRKAKKSFGGVESLKFVWRSFSGLTFVGRWLTGRKSASRPSEDPHFVNKGVF